MRNSRMVETLVGVFIALGLAGLLVLALQVSNLSSLGASAGYQLRAKFGNIGALKVRSPVKMAGVGIGRVSAIEFDNTTYEAVAVLTIDEQFNKIPMDTMANIYTSGLLGEQYVALDPGGEEDFLKDGDEITLTQSAVVLEQLIGQFLYDKASSEGG